MDGSLKILLVTGIFPPDVGGPSSFTLAIAKGLSRRGHELTVFSLADSKTEADESFEVVTLRRGMFIPLRIILTIGYIWRLARRSQVVLVAGLPIEFGIANLVLRRPCIHRVVGDLAWERALARGWANASFEDFQRSKHGARIRFIQRLRNWALRRADLVVTPSEYFAGHLRQWGIPSERVRVLYSPLLPFKAVVPTSLQPRTELNLVTLGRLISLKQIHLVIESIASMSNVGLVVIGDGPERLRLENLAFELGVEARVWFTGRQRRDDALSLIAACDVFVLPSTHEAFPFALIEAMAMGLPAMASDVGGIPELVRIAGHCVLVEPTREGVNTAIHRIVGDLESHRALALASQSRILERFSFDRFERETEQLLMEAVISRETS